MNKPKGFLMLALSLLLAAVLAFTLERCGTVEPDLEVMLAPRYALPSSVQKEIARCIEQHIPDLNSDGRGKVLLYHWPVDIPDEGMVGDIQTLNALDLKLAAAPEIVLYLMDANVARRYPADWFLDPAALDLDLPTKDGTLIIVGEDSWLARLCRPDRPLYLALRGGTEEETERFAAEYEAADAVRAMTQIEN